MPRTNHGENSMAKEMTLNVERFLVCSTGEEVKIPEPPDSLSAAIALRDVMQEDDDDETWEIVAEIAAQRTKWRRCPLLGSRSRMQG